MSTKSLGPDAFKYDKVLSLSRQASDEMWELRRLTGSAWLGSAKVGGVLTFGPTLINDILNNYNHNAKLDQKFNYKQFAVDSAKNQTGNLLSLGAGLLAPKVAVLIVPVLAGAGAPLVLIGFLGAIAVGVAYNYFEADQSVEKKSKNSLVVNNYVHGSSSFQ